MKKNSFILIFFLVLIIAVLNSIGNSFFLYWKFWWFDIVMHFLGGLWVGLSALWVYFFSGYFKDIKRNKKNIFFISLFSVLIIGLGWEVFEYIIKVNFSDNYISDTVSDLIMDICGSVVAYFLFLKENKK